MIVMGQLAVCLRGSHAERAYQRTINRRGVMSHMSESPEEMQHLVARIARAVVDNSRHVIVEASDYQGGTWLRVQVARSDIPKIIGQQRRTVGALRALLAAVTKKQHHLYMLDVREEMKNRVVDSSKSIKFSLNQQNCD